MSCAFTFSPRAGHVRKALLDQTILAVLYRLGTPSSVQDVLAGAVAAVGAAAPRDAAQVSASLQRLVGDKLVEASSGRFALSTAGLARIEAGPLKEESEREAVISALVSRVAASSPIPVDETTTGKLEGNARDLVVAYFRLTGLELANTFLQSATSALVYAEGLDEIRSIARRGVLPVYGDMLLLAFGTALSSPTADETAYFARCARAYVAAQVLNLDPSLREFQRTRFTEKTFVLDTDAVLEAIVRERPQSAAIRALIGHLAALGAKIVVPDEVVDEVVTHAEISPHTYNFFGARLQVIGEHVAEVRIRNAIVYGYWKASLGKRVSGMTSSDIARTSTMKGTRRPSLVTSSSIRFQKQRSVALNP